MYQKLLDVGYSVTEDGKVFYKGKELSQHKDTYGYWCFSSNLKPHTHRVHRFVAFVYIPNPNNLPIAMHLDDNKDHNYATNLCWGTSKQNNYRSNPNAVKYIPKYGKGQNNHRTRKDKEDIFILIKEGLSTNEITRQTGAGRNTINRYRQELKLMECND